MSLFVGICIYFTKATQSNVGFTLFKATKALRERRGINFALLVDSALEGVEGSASRPAAFYPQERPGTHCTGG
jgi:hypothetical protein